MAKAALTLARRNAALLLMSLINSGATTLLPQRFLARHVPDAKQFWLAATLLLGTFGAMAGVALSRRLRWRPRGDLWSLIGLTSLLLWLGLQVQSLALHIALHVAVRGAANFTTQDLDERAALAAGNQDRSANDRIGMAIRFAGMLIGPIWFALIPDGGWVSAAGLLALTALSLLSAHALAPSPSAAADAPLAPEPLSRRDRLIVLSGIAIYGTYYLLASNVLYVLTDLHHHPNATAFAGILITVVYGSAVLTTIAVGVWKRSAFALPWMLVAPIGMMFVSVALRMPGATHPAIAISASVALGVAYALFILAFRNHASSAAAAGATQWIAVFNNLGNTSALTGFGVMAFLAGFARVTQVPDAALVSVGLFGVALAGCIAMGLARSHASRPSVAIEPAEG